MILSIMDIAGLEHMPGMNEDDFVPSTTPDILLSAADFPFPEINSPTFITNNFPISSH